jgi:hypothetical protein
MHEARRRPDRAFQAPGAAGDANLVLRLVLTPMTTAALAPLVWAATLDGRYNDQQQRVYREQVQSASGHPPTMQTSRAE